MDYTTSLYVCCCGLTEKRKAYRKNLYFVVTKEFSSFETPNGQMAGRDNDKPSAFSQNSLLSVDFCSPVGFFQNGAPQFSASTSQTPLLSDPGPRNRAGFPVPADRKTQDPSWKPAGQRLVGDIQTGRCCLSQQGKLQVAALGLLVCFLGAPTATFTAVTSLNSSGRRDHEGHVQPSQWAGAGPAQSSARFVPLSPFASCSVIAGADLAREPRIFLEKKH